MLPLKTLGTRFSITNQNYRHSLSLNFFMIHPIHPLLRVFTDLWCIINKLQLNNKVYCSLVNNNIFQIILNLCSY